jgi:hypothetical protein
MNRLYPLLAALLLTVSALAQAPQKMSYQAVVRDAANALMINQKVGIKISLLQRITSSDAVYAETQTPTTNDNGLFSIEIGAGMLFSGSWTDIDWSEGPYFIHTETNPTGGTNYTITGNSQLMSVPYALYAATAENLTGGITEIDPLFSSSAASKITAADKVKWNSTSTTLDLKAPIADPTFTGTVSGIDKTMVGLTNVDNTSDANKPVSTATQTALDLKATLASPTFTGTVSGIDKTMVGLTNVDNTSDADKPVSTATQTALDLKAAYYPGTATGQMNYWDGSAWVVVAPGASLPGNQAQTLVFCNGVPTWGTCPAVVPTLTSTAAASSIGGSTASSGGVISDDGGGSITARGVAWGTNTSPTISGSYTADGTGTGTFTSSLSGLTPNTTYYVRAYATNSAGTAYGVEVSFTTSASLVLGEPLQGGIVAYIFKNYDSGYVAGEVHGLIVAIADQAPPEREEDAGVGAAWGCEQWTFATGIALGTGADNTKKILAECSEDGIAAKLSADYTVTVDGIYYDDWYLPSKDELNKLYDLHVLGFCGFAADGWYWSSTEDDIEDAWDQYFGDGEVDVYSKIESGDGVRAVRTF